MSRSGYSDDLDPLELGRWRQAVARAIEGRRGQALLRELLAALEEMPDKQLYSGNFSTADGKFCTLGVLGHKRGTKMDDLGDECECEPALVGQRFGIARAMAAEIMWLNDESSDDTRWVDIELCGPVRPHYPDYGQHKKTVCVANEKHAETRWARMHAWVKSQIKESP
jgi:hypothetical protein